MEISFPGLNPAFSIDNNINSIEGIKGFNADGYLFTKALSSDNELIFTR